jgi:outer membrane protein TolC
LLCAALSVGLGPWAARAQEARTDAARDPVLEALIQEALERNPVIRAASAASEAAGARVNQASAVPDPMFAVGYTNDGWSPSLGTQEMTTLGLTVTQALPGAGRRRLRGDVARAGAKGAQADVERAKLGTVAAVRRAYTGLLLARDLLEITREQQRLWSDLEQSARSRYGVGQGTQQDVLRAQVEVTRIQEAVIEQETDVLLRRAELNRLRGRELEAPIDTAARLELRPLDRSLDDLVREGERVSPELAAAAADIEGGRLAAELVGKERRPELTLQAGYMNRGGLDPMWQAGFGVSLPRRAKTSAARAEASAAERAAAERRQATALDLRLRAQQRFARARALERIAVLYAEGVVPQGRAALEAALANYQTGKVPFVTVLEALTQVYADRLAYLRRIAEHEQLQATIDEWSLEPAPSMGAAGMGGPRRGSMGAVAPAADAPATGDSASGGGAPMSMSR